MNIEEINSPLPPRRVNVPLNHEENPVPPRVSEPVEEVPQINQEEVPPTPPTPTSLIKKFLDKRTLMFAGIGAGVLLLLILIVTVLIPKIRNMGKVETVTVNYWGLWEDSSVLSGVIADFESKNPGIKINYKQNQKTDYRSRLAAKLMKTGVDEEAPDIFRIHQSWIPMFKDELAPVPVSTANSVNLESDFFDNYKKDLKVNNQFIAIPLMYDGLVMYYNKDLVESAQVAIPRTWWDFPEIAKKLTVVDDQKKIKVAGAALGLTDNVDHWSDIVGLMMLQNGADPMMTRGEDDSKIADILAFYTLFATQHKVWDETLPPSTQFFANGKLGFYFGPSWRVFNIEDLNPNLRYEIAPVPQLPTISNIGPGQQITDADLTNNQWSTYWVEGVNTKSKKQKEAFKFLEYLASKEALEKMYAAASQTRSFGEIYPRKSMAESIGSNQKVRPFVQTANQASSWYLNSYTHDGGLNDEMIKYFGDAINGMVFKNQNKNDVLPTLRNGINQLIQKYQLKRQ